MFQPSFNLAGIKTTSYKVVLPYYLYAALSFLVAAVLLFIHSESFFQHYFNPTILAITHTMALGWGTMLIVGASHQLVPVFIEGKLYSNLLAYISFALIAIGIPLLVYGFYTFNMQAPAKWGGRFVVIGLLVYFINLTMSMIQARAKNVHAVFVFTATLWLMYTVLLGLVLVYNFETPLVQHDSLHYLPLHAHAGIVGWFLLLVIGVGSRLIPMFLISKYTNTKLLWLVYVLINVALGMYLYGFYFSITQFFALLPAALILIAVVLFVRYCYQAYRQRLRKQVDEQMKISLLAVAMILLPIILLMFLLTWMITYHSERTNLVLTYGFLIFFGWLTSIMLGMTFKTLPFIVWNKVYHHRAAIGKTPNPKDLFHPRLFHMMAIAYVLGVMVFALGISFSGLIWLKIGALLMMVTAVFYNMNIISVVTHKAKTP